MVGASLYHASDFLDGGAGADELIASGGEYTLFGGAGNDQLYGDAGDDRLMGGEDNDSMAEAEVAGYTFTSNCGTDTLVDSDGLGSISRGQPACHRP